jgi:hypothetical protein
MRVADFRKEIGARSAEPSDWPLVDILEQERICSEYEKWQQGFTPKEHREMLDRQWMLQQEHQHRLEQTNQSRINLGVAFVAVVVAAVGIIVSANIGRDAAGLQADATLKAAEMQIQEARDLATQTALVTPGTAIPQTP